MGVPLAACTTREFIDWLVEQSTSRERAHPAFITYINAWCSNVSEHDPEYNQLLRQADLVYADGQAIVWASRILGDPVPERVNAADFILDFCRAAAARGVTIYALGSPEGVARKATERFQQQIPSLKIVGSHSGYFPDHKAMTAEIAAAGADLLIVGMGVPLQEKWVAANLSECGVRAIWCVGAMFEYFADYRARAPEWVRRAGLEWAFRLILEPSRLWRRYVIGNSVFLWRVARAAASRRRR